MGTVVLHNVVSVDGYIADLDDDIGPLFEWYSNGDVALTDGGELKVSQASAEYIRQALELGLVDEVAMDVVPVVFGSGKRYCGSVGGQHLLEDPELVIRGDRVLHLRYRVRR